MKMGRCIRVQGESSGEAQLTLEGAGLASSGSVGGWVVLQPAVQSGPKTSSSLQRAVILNED